MGRGGFGTGRDHRARILIPVSHREKTESRPIQRESTVSASKSALTSRSVGKKIGGEIAAKTLLEIGKIATGQCSYAV